MLKIDEINPFKHTFILKIPTRLEICNAKIDLMFNEELKFKELVISYKTIFRNTFTIYGIDLSTKHYYSIFKHESFHLWENQIRSIFVPDKHEICLLDQNGISVVSFSSEP